jgi:hypothetical protein
MDIVDDMENPQQENAEAEGPKPAGTDGPSQPLQLSEIEQQILDLYDRLEELMLETSLLRVQGTISNGTKIQSSLFIHLNMI